MLILKEKNNPNPYQFINLQSLQENVLPEFGISFAISYLQNVVTSAWKIMGADTGHCERLPGSFLLQYWKIFSIQSRAGPQQTEGKVKAILIFGVTVEIRGSCPDHNWDKLLPSNRDTATKIQSFILLSKKTLTVKDTAHFQLSQILKQSLLYQRVLPFK